MSFNQQDGDPHEDVPLEDRLRGLIMNNAQPGTGMIDAGQPSHAVLISATVLGTDGNEKGATSKKQTNSQLPLASTPLAQSPQSGKKRLNQAQRRQMNAQFQFPVEPRPAPNQYAPSRGFSTSTGFSSQPYHHGQQRQVRQQPFHYTRNYQDPSQPPVHSSQIQAQQQTPQSIISPANTQRYPGSRPSFGPMQSDPKISNIGHRQQTNERFEQHIFRPPGDRPVPKYTQLYQPGPYGGQARGPSFGFNPDQVSTQSSFLDVLINEYVPRIGISDEEISTKEAFRANVENICRTTIEDYEHNEAQNLQFDPMSVELKCFGSMASGFATKASDMDLALFSPHSDPPPDSTESPIPRIIEKKLLDLGYGARLLTRTRVPIIKLCQQPTVKLMSDLLDERSKWENGFIAEDDDENEEIADPQELKHGAEENLCNDHVGEATGKSATVIYHERLSAFRQRPNQSLGDYYGSAKRLLRKLGGRDIASLHSGGLSEDEIKILTDVCKVFLGGLSDEPLKRRLTAYRSLSLLTDQQSINLRSLSGVFIQVEGEELAMSWDSRLVHEATERLETDCARQVENWKNLMNRVDADITTYNRMLHQNLETLKRIPSLQLLSLEQGLHEDPTQYYARTSRIMSELQAKDKESTVENKNTTAVIVGHYIAGIRQSNIQDALRTLASGNELITLESLAVQHRVLQLADDYETASAKNLYAEYDHADIEQYVTLLRNGTLNNVDQPLPLTTAISLRATDATRDLIKKMRSLPDPSQVSHKPRDKYKDHLEYPKQEVGIQCDINFCAHLGLHNTLLLRCYSLTDSRVKPLVLFVKFWAKVRGINTPYRGSLSSYGYVLMVLHYLTNIINPFVCPNLQELQPEPPVYLPPAEIARQTTCNGYNVRFWRNENGIVSLAERGMLNQNHDSLGKLLRGFFEYYAQTGQLSTGARGFDWGRDVLSLRTVGGLLTKQEKGWVGARTTLETTTQVGPAATSATTTAPATSTTDDKSPTINVSVPRKLIVKEEVKEIRHRYLFAIEDPFEIDHNVARTVTHNGIVSIRDEFRRAWRIIRNAGKAGQEGLLDEIVEEGVSKGGLQELMDLIHGKDEPDIKAT